MGVRLLVAAALVVAALPTLAFAGGAKLSPNVSARLTGSAETPKKGEEGASARVVIKLDAAKGRACWQFSALKKVESPTASHIHKGKKGKAGPVAVPLGGKFKAKGCISASKGTIRSIEANPSAFYVNIHNAEYPDGVVRGQLAAR